MLLRNRRETILGMSAASLAVPAAAFAYARPPTAGALVDVHCHVFNASDLPATRFLKIVFLEMHREEAAPSLDDIDDPDFVDALIRLFLWILRATTAPSAEDEIRVLDGRKRPVGRSVRADAANIAVADATASYLSSDRAADPTGADARLISAILKAGGRGGEAAPPEGPLSTGEARTAARRAVRSDFKIGRYLRWFALFTRYRHSLVDDLAKQYAQQRQGPILLAPALIDYDAWLGERVTKSPLRSQVQVMGRIARRPRGPAVHGYVAYDPLRQIQSDMKLEQERPLDLVREAILEHGFLGVKVYPPMGFRATGNAELAASDFPKAVVEAIGSANVGRRIDNAMDQLFDALLDLDAPLLAHASESNGAGDDYAKRADPSFWIRVLQDSEKRRSKLRLTLAHFGRFSSRAFENPGILPDVSWEWALGNYVKAHPASLVFGDISYLAEIAGKSDPELGAYARIVRRWIDAFDPDCRHLVFGSDWVMLGAEAIAKNYAQRVRAFFKDYCRLNDAQLRRLFSGNAARFLGLRDGDKPRSRLLDFYNRHRLDPSRLPVFDPS